MWNILYWRTTRHCFDLARHHHNDALSFSKPLLLEKNEGELRGLVPSQWHRRDSCSKLIRKTMDHSTNE